MSESIAGASLKRTLGPFSVLLFGLAFLAPLIVFGTYGVITQASGNTTAMAYLIAAIGVVFGLELWPAGQGVPGRRFGLHLLARC